MIDAIPGVGAAIVAVMSFLFLRQLEVRRLPAVLGGVVGGALYFVAVLIVLFPIVLFSWKEDSDDQPITSPRAVALVVFFLVLLWIAVGVMLTRRSKERRRESERWTQDICRSSLPRQE